MVLWKIMLISLSSNETNTENRATSSDQTRMFINADSEEHAIKCTCACQDKYRTNRVRGHIKSYRKIYVNKFTHKYHHENVTKVGQI